MAATSGNGDRKSQAKRPERSQDRGVGVPLQGESKPSLNALLPAIPRLTNSWFDLGLALGAEDFTLRNKEKSNRDDPEKCCREMLQDWINGKPDCGNGSRTWNALLLQVQRVVGSKASAFIERNILNWKEDGDLMELETAGSASGVVSPSAQWQIQYPIIDELADEFISLVREIRRVIRDLGHYELREFKECVEDKLKLKDPGLNVTLPDCADDLIDKIRKYWDHLNFEFTKSVVRYLSNDKLKKKMKSYEKEVKMKVGKCLKECKTREIRPKPPPHWETMSVKLDVNPFSYSLHKIFIAKDFLVNKVGIRDAIFAGFQPGSLFLFFYIPRNAIWIAAARSPSCIEDFHKMKMVKVEVEGHISFDVATGKIIYLSSPPTSACPLPTWTTKKQSQPSTSSEKRTPTPRLSALTLSLPEVAGVHASEMPVLSHHDAVAMLRNMDSVAAIIENLEVAQKELGLFAVTTDPDVIDQQLVDQAFISQKVQRVRQDMETLKGEMLDEEYFSEVSTRLSKLEHAVSHHYSKLEAAKEKAEHIEEMKCLIDPWLTEKEQKLAYLEGQPKDQETLDSISELSRELDDFCYTIEKLDKFTHALLDTSSESVTGDVEEPAPNLAGMLESTTISTSPGALTGESELKRRYEEIKRRALHLRCEMPGLVIKRKRAFEDISGTIEELTDATEDFYSERRIGSDRVRASANELDSIFKWLVASLVLAVAAAGIGAGTAGIASFFTAGLTAPIAIALGAAAVAGGAGVSGVAAGAAYWLKTIEGNAVLREAEEWIVKDRPRCELILYLIDVFERSWQEMQANFPNRQDMDDYFREKGIDAWILRERYEELAEVGRRWRSLGFGSYDEDVRKKAEAAVREFLESDTFSQILAVVTMFLGLVAIGAIAHDVAKERHSKPPIRKLLRTVADRLEEDAAPAGRMAEAPWRIQKSL